MLEHADIQDGHSVLEPSAGKGDILDAISERHADAGLSTHAIELHSGLRDLLKLKGHNVVDNNFLDHKGEYDRIVMNPPFERGRHGTCKTCLQAETRLELSRLWRAAELASVKNSTNGFTKAVAKSFRSIKAPSHRRSIPQNWREYQDGCYLQANRRQQRQILARSSHCRSTR